MDFIGKISLLFVIQTVRWFVESKIFKLQPKIDHVEVGMRSFPPRTLKSPYY